MDKSIEITKTNEKQQPVVVVEETLNDEKFRPKGAIAFFVVLLLICAAIWYSVYYIQLMRQ